jgi:hypothetical protein
MKMGPYTVREEYWLPLGAVADEWVRNGANEEVVRQSLWNWYWCGLFEDFYREAPSPYPMTPRREMLIAISKIPGHPGIVFAESDNGDEELEDGTVLVDLRTWIALPEDPADSTSAQLKKAYAALANVSMAAIELSALAGLMCQFVGAYELLAVCEKLGIEVPPFWHHWAPARKKTGVLQQLALLANWLHHETLAIGHVKLTKDELFEQATEKFPGLKRNRFNTVWEVMASPEMQKGGRPRGSKNVVRR